MDEGSPFGHRMQEMQFGRYLLRDLLGRGGMGQVYQAYDTATRRDVAFKVLPEHAANDPDFRRRFEREAYSAAGVTDPHIVPIYDFGEIGGRLYLAMQLIKGTDLATMLTKGGSLEPALAVAIIEQIGAALDAAHTAGLIHRDVKPSNILLTDKHFAYLIDFGIAHALGSTSLTATGAAVGTFAYMAPERLTAGVVDARADIYALTCVLHECLTGTHPFPGNSVERQIAGHLGELPPNPSQLRPGIPTAFDEVIARGMAKNPDHRYRTAGDLARAARAALESPAQPQQPTRRISEVHTIFRGDQPPWTAPPAPTARAENPRRRKLILLVALVLVAVVGVGAILWKVLPENDTTATAPTQVVVPFAGLKDPGGVAVHTNGDVFVADTSNNRVLRLAAGSSTQTELPFSGLNHPWAVAVNSSGDVFVTDTYNNRVLRLPAGSSTQTEIPFTGLTFPIFVAVNSTGDVYVTEERGGRVVVLSAKSATQTELPFRALSQPAGVAVSAAGDVYVVDNGNNRVLQLTAGSDSQTELAFTGLSSPVGVAVENTGDVFLTDNRNLRVLKLAAGSNVQTTVPFSGLLNPKLVALTASGSVLVTDADRVLELRSQ